MDALTNAISRDPAVRLTWRDTDQRDAEFIAAKARVTHRMEGHMPRITKGAYTLSLLEQMGIFGKFSDAKAFVVKLQQTLADEIEGRKQHKAGGMPPPLVTAPRMTDFLKPAVAS